MANKKMTENHEDATEESSEKKIDLSALKGFEFGPSWADASSGQTSRKQPSNPKTHGKKNEGGIRRDRRGSPEREHNKNGNNSRRSLTRSDSGGREVRHSRYQSTRDIFQPTVIVSIYPQDEAFEALVKRLRSTVRTYQLFEIANLILEKPERYAVVVQNKAKKDEKPKPLYYSVPKHLPFETEDAAVNYVLSNHLEQFFDIEAIELEPPKGNFQMVNRCTLTGELLGPPNYHRYQEFLQRHYSSRISNMSFERFVAKVEPVKDQESIDAWVESMKKGFRYTLKEPQEGQPESFDSLEAVRSFLLLHRKDAIVGTAETVRFAGRDIGLVPRGDLRRSVEMYIENQLRFPLDTANNIRGRLRRYKFTVYKKGSKGVAYVCAVKRKFRDSKTVFTPSILEVIELIEKNPGLPASRLPKLYLGIGVEKQKPVKLEMDESEPAETSEGAADKISEEATLETDAAQVAGSAESTATDAPASTTELTPQSKLGEEELKRLRQLMLDLRWLVMEGYVTEYGDGHLFAPPPMPEPKPRDSQKQNAAEAELAKEPEKVLAEASEAVLGPDKTDGNEANETAADTPEGFSESEEKL